MDTFIINLNDTVAFSDSTLIELAKVVNTCQPCIQEAETTCSDVKIVGIICLAIVLTVLIVSVALYLLQKAKCEYVKEVSEQKFKQEKEISNLEAEIKNTEKDKELERYKAKCEFDLEKDCTLEKNKTDYQVAGEFFKQLCDATKDKEGKFDNAKLDILLKFFREEWGESGKTVEKEKKTEDSDQKQ